MYEALCTGNLYGDLIREKVRFLSRPHVLSSKRCDFSLLSTKGCGFPYLVREKVRFPALPQTV
jgi:hypothetical protein